MTMRTDPMLGAQLWVERDSAPERIDLLVAAQRHGLRVKATSSSGPTVRPASQRRTDSPCWCPSAGASDGRADDATADVPLCPEY